MDLNYLLIGLIILAVINIVRGYKQGMVKAVISLVSLVILCVIVSLLGYGISSYNDGNFFHVALMLILLLVLGTVHILLGVVFFSAKIVVKLPVVHSVDKLLGILFGLLETVLILWTIYTFVMMMDLGVIEDMIVTWTDQNPVLTWLYKYNYLAHFIERLLGEFNFVPLTEILSLGR